jgi:hypothetical protein
MQFFKRKFANRKGNAWNPLKTEASISEFGLKATTAEVSQCIFAKEGYDISAECRTDNFHFPGTIYFYYEVTITRMW